MGELWGGVWLPKVKGALGITADVDSIILTFTTSDYLRVWTSDGQERRVNVFGIESVRKYLGLPSAAQRIAITIRADSFVTITAYQFAPLEAQVETIVEFIKGTQANET